MSEKIDVLKLPVEKQFMKRLIKPDTWILNGFVEDCAAPHPHVVVGEKYAAVIDTTDLPYNVRDYVEKCVTDKPLIVLCSHSHGDHTGNNYQFKDCPVYMTQACWDEISYRKDHPMVFDGVVFEQTPHDYEPVIIKDGDVIDLGGRTLTCIDFNGCHSLTSIAYLDSAYGCLFTGDEFEGGQVLIGGAAETSCVEFYLDNLKKLKAAVNGKATCICPPHNGSPLDIQTLDNMIENCERIMDGHEGMKEIGSMSFGLNPQSYHDLPFTKDPDEVNDGTARLSWGGDDQRRSEWKGTSIVYNQSRIRYTDIRKEAE